MSLGQKWRLGGEKEIVNSRSRRAVTREKLERSEAEHKARRS